MRTGVHRDSHLINRDRLATRTVQHQSHCPTKPVRTVQHVALSASNCIRVPSSRNRPCATLVIQCPRARAVASHTVSHAQAQLRNSVSHTQILLSSSSSSMVCSTHQTHGGHQHVLTLPLRHVYMCLCYSPCSPMPRIQRECWLTVSGLVSWSAIIRSVAM